MTWQWWGSQEGVLVPFSMRLAVPPASVIYLKKAPVWLSSLWV